MCPPWPRRNPAGGALALGIGLLALLPVVLVGAQADGFARAEGPRELRFPEDHGSHPEFRTEWWYVTGHVTAEGGDLFGYQATWFRSALAPEIPIRRSNLAARDILLFHGSVTDVEGERFLSRGTASRAVSTWAGAATGRLGVFLLDTRLEEVSGKRGWFLRSRVGEAILELELHPRRPPLLHGEVPGLSRKGDEPGEASYYVSQTRLETVGTIDFGGTVRRVRGQSWFDHEFFTGQLDEEQVGWDWFSVALDDGTDLMLFELREKDGGIAATSSGTLRDGGGRHHLSGDDFAIEILDRWRSPGGTTYPARWRIEVPERSLSLVVEPLVADQEHGAEEIGTAYWEGLCRFRGTRQGKTVRGLGYVELVGYAGQPPMGL